MQLVSTDEELAMEADYILSIVPPRDAVSTAKRILDASSLPSFQKRITPLYYLDLNAISPRTAREIAQLLRPAGDGIRFLDGGIIGGPPRPNDDSASSPSSSSSSMTPQSWTRPSIPVSGPYPIGDAQHSGAHLADVLNIQHISGDVGPASGLKMCFASLTKGMTALAIQSFTTAHRLNVLPHLQSHLEHYSPKTLELANKGVVGMPPKAYRWVKEMEEIAATFAEDGGFEGENVFGGIAGTYDLVANGTELGKEKTGQRERGTTAEDVAGLMSEGVERRKVKTD